MAFTTMCDTYALATGMGRALMLEGGNIRYLVSPNHILSHSLKRDIASVVNQKDRNVLGAVRYSPSAQDFSYFLLQAQASKAKVIGLANAGWDTQNAARQAGEFGITQSGQTLATLMIFDMDLKGMGLNVAQGLQFITDFYWDYKKKTRDWSQRFYAQQKAMPTMHDPGRRLLGCHDLGDFKATGTSPTKPAIQKTKETPIDDFFAEKGKIRKDGRRVHDIYLAEAKKSSESKGEKDLLKIERIIRGNQEFQPLAQSTARPAKR